jgi:hypothetical protein
VALEMKYFVLKPKGPGPHAEASRIAMVAYASSIISTDKELAYSLNEWASREGKLESQSTERTTND